MTDPDQEWDRTQRFDRIPELVRVPGAHRAPDPDEPAPGADWDTGTWDAPDEEPPARPRDPLWMRLTRGVGELLVTAGLITLLFVVYELYITDLLNDRTQDQLSQEIHQQWDDAGPAPTVLAPMTEAPAVGEPLAVLHIPRLGADYERVVLEGTAEDELSQGPGHYEGTALPGQPGNVALAGHRVGKGSPFLDLDKMQPGDPIVVETADGWYTYRVLGDASTGDFLTDPSGIPGQQIVKPEQVEVIAPTPGAAGSTASGSYLTLTTCHPKYSARQRLIIHAVQDGPGISKADAPDGPPALEED